MSDDSEIGLKLMISRFINFKRIYKIYYKNKYMLYSEQKEEI